MDVGLCTAKDREVADPYATDDAAYEAYKAFLASLPHRGRVILAYIIPPDGEGEIIALAGRVPANPALT